MGKFAERQRRKVNGLRSDDYDGITAIICKCRIAVFLSSRGKQEHRVLSVPVFFERKNTFMKKLFLLGTILIIAVTLIFLVCCNKAEVTDTITTEYGDCFNIVQDGDGYSVQNGKTNGYVAYFRYKSEVSNPRLIESLYCSERIRCYIVGNSTIIFRKSQDDYYTEIDKFYLEQLSESNKKLDEELVPIIESVILRNKIIFNNCIQ